MLQQDSGNLNIVINDLGIGEVGFRVINFFQMRDGDFAAVDFQGGLALSRSLTVSRGGGLTDSAGSRGSLREGRTHEGMYFGRSEFWKRISVVPSGLANLWGLQASLERLGYSQTSLRDGQLGARTDRKLVAKPLV